MVDESLPGQHVFQHERDLTLTRAALGNLLAALMRHDPRGTATEVYQAQLDIAKAMDEGKRVMGFPFVTQASGGTVKNG